MSAMRHLPDPPEYLDPLSDLDGSHYYAVPKFFSYNHPNTRWLMSMLVHNRIEGIIRKMELTPALFNNAYYQLADDPRLYHGPHSNQPPVFHKQAVLYFTTLAAAIYLCEDEHCVDSLLNYRDTYKEPMYSANSVQYATHVQSPQTGDLHAFPVYVIMLRCCKFNCALALLRHGWAATQPLAMPLRRLRERRILRVADWLDYALLLLTERPTYPLPALAAAMARDPMLWPRGRLPISQLLSGNVPGEDAAQHRELILDADDLILVPENRQQQPTILGARTLAELVKDYGRYQRAKQLCLEARAQLRRGRAQGIEPEHLLAQSLDYSAAYRRPVPRPVESPILEFALGNTEAKGSCCNTGSNNSARKSSSLTAADEEQSGNYASDPVRILHHALERDRQGKSGRQCSEAADVYIKRGYFMTEQPLATESPQLRDARNAVVLLMNLAHRELDLMDQCKSPSRRGAYQRNAAKLLQMSTMILLHSKEFATFARNEARPTYQLVREIDFPFTTGLIERLPDIRLSVAREFNVDPVESSRYLTVDQMQDLLYAAEKGSSPTAAALRLKLRLGQPPRFSQGQLVQSEQVTDGDSDTEDRVKTRKEKKRTRCGRNRNYYSPSFSDNSNWILTPMRSPRISFVRVVNRKTTARRQQQLTGVKPNSTGEPVDTAKQSNNETNEPALLQDEQPMTQLETIDQANSSDPMPADCSDDLAKDQLAEKKPSRPHRLRWLTRFGQRVRRCLQRLWPH
ncbi:hypothetical protein BOX15_Mlig009405g1 [Macrostomum lignano]|nr:hypothetical protein BOX15_Mlig009405g3 [Macrostomum lignano]PAA67005.1 hypothetical protein BOX15_Mlig009405g1 [Macrostomum lignano]